MKLLFSDLEAEEEDAKAEHDIRQALDLVHEELGLFSHPAWQIYTERLASMVNKDLETLVNCPTDEVAPQRARIKLERHLLGLEGRLRSREAELRASLEAPEEDYE